MVTKAEKETAERITRVEERTKILYWILSILVAFVVAEAVQLYLLNGRVSGIETDIRNFGTAVAEVRLRQSASAPSDPKNIKEAVAILATAKAKGIKLSQDVITATGASFLAVADKNPQAWAVARQYLDYRTFLNADFEPKLTPATGKSKYQSSVTVIPNPEHPERHKAFTVSFVGGYAPVDKSARLEMLDKPQPEGSEFAFFMLDGGMDTVVLDGAYMKNVIVRNSDVAYNGGAIRLENVYFVNCTFRSSFQLTPKSIDLGTTILATVPTTFDATGKTAGGL